MIGQTISHYKILEKLGEGGMGVVYKAQDTKLDRLVALKFLPAHLSRQAEGGQAASEQNKARFIQEAKTAAALNHPNVCSIIDIQEHDGQMFIVMEYVDGQTLREKKQAYSIKQAVDIGIQIADGLAAAHEKGIVHRDIKPENIMIRKDGIVQIMDFGLAKLRGASRITKEGSTVGTVGYMSPEQVQGLDTDHRTDIFSLGVILYELLTGQSPFKGVHETAIIYEIVNVDPVPMSTVRQEIVPELDAIILECLTKEPAERYQSVAEVAKDLRRFKRESSRERASRISVAREAYRTPVGMTSEISERVQAYSLLHRFKRDPLAWSIAGAFLLCVITIIAVYISGSSPATL
ncbi:MAG: serine/threonine-protein kinase, partial [Bacteroidota bacterium]